MHPDPSVAKRCTMFIGSELYKEGHITDDGAASDEGTCHLKDF